MRLRALSLPLAFAVLGTGSVLPFAAFPGFPVVPAAAVAAGLGAVCGTLVWIGTAGPASSVRRGALRGAIATLTGAICTAPVLLAALAIGSRGAGPETLVDLAVGGGLVTMLTVLGGSVAAVPAAVLGAAVAARPAFDLPPVEAVSTAGVGSALARLGSTPDATLRQLTVVVAVVTAGALGAATIQYTDPTTPATGGGPAYAGADAPAATQVSQAQARTRSVSHVATLSVTVYGANGTVERERSFERRIVHDRRTDRVRVTARSQRSGGTVLYTEDGAWRWAGTATDPPADEIEPARTGPGLDPYRIAAESDAPASVVERTDESVVVRYPTPTSQTGVSSDAPGNRTVRIDRSTGRLAAIEMVRATDDGRVVRTTRFEYGNATVRRPDSLPRPLDWHVFDLVAGPLNGETPLHG